MHHAVYRTPVRFEYVHNRPHVDARRRQKHVSDRFSLPLSVRTKRFVEIGNEFSHERIAVRMNACRRKTDEYVSRSYLTAAYKLFFFTDADAETRDVVFALVVKARHFGGFASEQRAARIFAACGDSFYDFARNLRVERTAGDVVEKKKRRHTRAEDIVDAHRNAVDADGIVFFHLKGDVEFCADAVRTAYHNGFFDVFRHGEHTVEASDTRQKSRDHGFRRRFFVFVDRFISFADVDAAFFVIDGFRHIAPRKNVSPVLLINNFN